MLLLDPTIDKGVPLWRGRRNWHPTPDPRSAPSEWPKLPPEPKNFYDDFLYWAQKPNVFSTFSSGPTSSVHVPMQALLHLVCSEWLTMSDYIKTRLNQIDLEIVKPKKFAPDNHIDIALERLHMWRRLIPLYREMISETLQQVFRFPCHTETFPSIAAISSIIQQNPVVADRNIHQGTFLDSNETLHQVGPAEAALATNITDKEAIRQQTPGDVPSGISGNISTLEANPVCPKTRTPDTVQGAPSPPNPEGTQQPRLGSITAYRNDFVLALSYLEEYQKRIDRLTSVVTAVMKIEDSRRALRDARNIGRLTWLATFFIPFSLIATAFCMQPNVTDISAETVRLYFTSSLPLAFVTVVVAWTLSHPSVQKYLSKLFSRIGYETKKNKARAD